MKMKLAVIVVNCFTIQKMFIIHLSRIIELFSLENCERKAKLNPKHLFTLKRKRNSFQTVNVISPLQVSGKDEMFPVQYSSVQEHIRITNEGDKPQTFCFVAPDKFTGNQLGSFLTKLKFSYIRKGKWNHHIILEYS